jgi:hypothetical protein
VGARAVGVDIEALAAYLWLWRFAGVPRGLAGGSRSVIVPAPMGRREASWRRLLEAGAEAVSEAAAD